MRTVYWFHELTKENLSVAGGKGANLGEMLRAGFPVPDGFVVSAEAYLDFIKRSGIADLIKEKTTALDVENTQALNAASEAIKAAITSAAMPPDIQADIVRAYNQLCGVEIPTPAQEVFVAVRSSATAEDLPSIAAHEPVLVKLGEEVLFLEIEKLYERLANGDAGKPLFVPSLKNNRIEWLPVQELYKHPAKEAELVRITTHTGRSITITPKHSLITLDPDTLTPRKTSISELGKDARVPVTMRIPLAGKGPRVLKTAEAIKSKPVVQVNNRVYIREGGEGHWKTQNSIPSEINIDEDLAYFIGAFLANGSTHDKNLVDISCGSQAVRNKVADFCDKIGLRHKDSTKARSIRIHSPALVALLHDLTSESLPIKGKSGSARIKRVPNFVFNQPREIIAALLRGFFDSGGGIEGTVVTATTVSKMLVAGVVKLLELLGIPCYIRKGTIKRGAVKRGAVRRGAVINVPAHAAEMFANIIGFTDEEKRGKLQQLISRYGTRRKTWNKGKGAPKACSIPKACSVNRLRKLAKGLSSKLNSKELVDMLDVTESDVLSESDVLWDHVDKVEKVAYTGNVYDFVVPETQNFVAGLGGIVTHNSASFAGQQATFLNVKGADNLLKAVQNCWASLFEARAIYYRAQQGFDHLAVGIAVPVQRMVQSAASGVAFSVDPVTNDPNRIVIEAGYGLGEAIVSGLITPDRYYVDKRTLKIISKEINRQEVKIARVGERNEHVEVPLEAQEDQKISDEQIIALAEYVKRIEEHYNFPQDIEWAIEDGNIYIVQSRAITTLRRAAVAGRPVMVHAPPREVPPEEAAVLLEGLGASPGLATGVVKVILDPRELYKLKEGEILVTKMTNPDFVVGMRRAKAIITDEGGATCFTGDVKVLTNKGPLDIAEVYKLVTSEEIFALSINPETMRAEWKKVTAAMRRKAEAIAVSVSQTGDAKDGILKLTPGHKMLIFNNRRLVEKKMEDVLSDEDALCTLDRLPPPIAKQNKNTTENKKLAYLIGAFITNGSWRDAEARAESLFIQRRTPEKQEFIDTVNQYFDENFSTALTPSAPFEKTYSSQIPQIRGYEFTSTAMRYNCGYKVPAQIFEKYYQNLLEWVIEVDEESISLFLAGIVDGHGSFNKRHGCGLHIYSSDEKLTQAIVLACLRLGIQPKIEKNRGTCCGTCSNIQLTEGLDKILRHTKRAHTKRVKASPRERSRGKKLFAARQLFSDIIEEVNFDEANWRGWIKTYVNNNLLIDAEKISRYIIPSLPKKTVARSELERILESPIRSKRVKKLKDLGVQDVYNITVEDNHNYVVFTENLIPVIVANCHAAIVSRELGIPCIVGTREATKVLRDEQVVSVDAIRGIVYEGEVAFEAPPKPAVAPAALLAAPVVPAAPLTTGTKIYVNLAEPEKAEEVAAMNVDGVGLFRAEFLIASLGVHPMKLVKEGREEEFIDAVAKGLRKVCAAFYPRPVVYRANDFKTNEYRGLAGGEEFEPVESNPMLGYRGCFRYIKEPQIFRMELRAIKRVREKYGMKNLWLMIPFVRRVGELKHAKKLMHEEGLYRTKDFKLWIMVEVPSTVFLIDRFIDVGIDGVSIGSNDLTQLIMGIDRDNPIVAEAFDERNEAVLAAIRRVIERCNARGVTSSLCGQAPSVYPEFAEFLVECGITSMSVNPDVIDATRRIVASAEQKILLKKAREAHETRETREASEA